jgi:predicted transcriptional regulator
MARIKQTVKYKLLRLMKGKGTIRRKDLCLLIFKAQGKKGDEAKKYRPGYYGTNLKAWIHEGLLEQPNGKGYRLTKVGLRYIANPQVEHHKIQSRLAKERYKRMIDNYRDLRDEVRGLKSKLRDIERIVNF